MYLHVRVQVAQMADMKLEEILSYHYFQKIDITYLFLCWGQMN